MNEEKQIDTQDKMMMLDRIDMAKTDSVKRTLL